MYKGFFVINQKGSCNGSIDFTKIFCKLYFFIKIRHSNFSDPRLEIREKLTWPIVTQSTKTMFAAPSTATPSPRTVEPTAANGRTGSTNHLYRQV
jgi:hypothetical protein